MALSLSLSSPRCEPCVANHGKARRRSVRVSASGKPRQPRALADLDEVEVVAEVLERVRLQPFLLALLTKRVRLGLEPCRRAWLLSLARARRGGGWPLCRPRVQSRRALDVSAGGVVRLGRQLRGRAGRSRRGHAQRCAQRARQRSTPRKRRRLLRRSGGAAHGAAPPCDSSAARGWRSDARHRAVTRPGARRECGRAPPFREAARRRVQRQAASGEPRLRAHHLCDAPARVALGRDAARRAPAGAGAVAAGGR